VPSREKEKGKMGQGIQKRKKKKAEKSTSRAPIRGKKKFWGFEERPTPKEITIIKNHGGGLSKMSQKKKRVV